MTERDQLRSPERRYLEIIPLTDSDRAVIGACEFMVGHAANPYVSAIGVWLDDAEGTFMRPTLLRQCQERNAAIALKLQTIAENLSHLQTHTRPEVLALHDQMSQSYQLLQRLHEIGQKVAELVAANMAAPIDPTSALAQELRQLDGQLAEIRAAFAPLVPQVDGNAAYRSYRAVVGENRQLNNALKKSKPA